MTTLVGIKAGNGEGGVVLGSDMSRTQTGWNPQGDIAYRVQRRIEGQKIYVDNKRELALCMSGVFDRQYVDFLSAVLEGDINFRESVERGSFNELAALNLNRWEGRFPDTSLLNGLLVATVMKGSQIFILVFPLAV